MPSSILLATLILEILEGRWEFVGGIAEEGIRKLYIGKIIKKRNKLWRLFRKSWVFR